MVCGGFISYHNGDSRSHCTKRTKCLHGETEVSSFNFMYFSSASLIKLKLNRTLVFLQKLREYKLQFLL